MPVSFYLPKLVDLRRFDDIDPEADWTPFRSARGQSVPHTYIRLRQAGHPVRITNRPPRNGIVVVFAGDMRRLRENQERNDRPVVVCVQTDRRVPEVSRADVIVQHNGLRADGHRRVFLPNWPQPGLVGRDRTRGRRVRTVSYKGALENLHPSFLTEPWSRFLEGRGLTFVIDAEISPGDPRIAGLAPAIQTGSKANWHDYSETDVVLAVRPASRDRYRNKPAVKLVNAWRAGTPALLGPEPAYQELRDSELDYLEVNSTAEASAALARLCDDPVRFEQMVANGLERAGAFSVESITERWVSLLFDDLAAWRPNRLPRLVTPVTVPTRRAWRGLRRRMPLPSIGTGPARP